MKKKRRESKRERKRQRNRKRTRKRKRTSKKKRKDFKQMTRAEQVADEQSHKKVFSKAWLALLALPACLRPSPTKPQSSQEGKKERRQAGRHVGREGGRSEVGMGEVGRRGGQ